MLSTLPPPARPRRQVPPVERLRVALRRSPIRTAAVLFGLLVTALGAPAAAQEVRIEPPADQNAGYDFSGPFRDPFRQLDEVWPTPGETRLGSGAPGPEYWQQKVDYDIEITLDENARTLTGSEEIRYENRSPHSLDYLWLQLDNNKYRPESISNRAESAPEFDQFGFGSLRGLLARHDWDGGLVVRSVADASGEPLPHTIVDTMMRVDLPRPLAPGGTLKFSVDWTLPIPDSDKVWARTGFEYFPEDGNDIFEIAHWFPRLCAYTDYTGWQNKQFLGRGEFTLEFGDYRVAITVPADHIVAATGELQNAEAVLTEAQRQRLRSAEVSDRPLFVVTPDEALANESERAPGTKTWIFDAKNVRDFAFASSRKFIWDAMGVRVDDGSPNGRVVLAMSYFPKEGEPLWSRYSTQAVAHTIDVYGKFAFPYPYPVAISVNGPVYGMEYPMICFNGPRPEEDGTYSKRTKYGLISVVIHEVGHNWFPMIVNSDERQWTWMDEGLNTFVQFLAEQEWEVEYPSRRGEADNIVEYMTSGREVPIMTNSESLKQFGANAYAKPATALNILRETVLGRDLFDHAFRTYSERWKFKRPEPYDFFRTLEDATAIDLDWFWRGWFYSTAHVDVAIRDVQSFVIESPDPQIAKATSKEERDRARPTLTALRNRNLPKRLDAYPELSDFYNDFDPLDVTPADLRDFESNFEELEDWQRQLYEANRTFTVVEIENVGGLVMPLIIELEFEDGTTEQRELPAEAWLTDARRLRKLFVTTLPVARVRVDPNRAIADSDRSNNTWPPERTPTRFELFRDRDDSKNPMQNARDEEERKAKAESEDGTDAADSANDSSSES